MTIKEANTMTVKEANTLTVKEAKERILNFVSANMGKSVLFASLDEAGRYDYVLTKSYNYYNSFLKQYDALTRAVKNANAHKSNGYDVFTSRVNEHIVIS